jgi:hypothetical protein
MGPDVTPEAAVDDQLEQIFCREIVRQAKFGLMGIAQINEGLRTHQNVLLWYGVQAALVAGGNVSKLLWPADARRRDRGNHLRSILKVGDDHFLAPRHFRNHFEHFDERLEKWASESERGNIVDDGVFAPGAIQGIDTGDYLRNYDPSTNSVTFRGDSYDMQRLADSLSEVIRCAEPYTEPRWPRESR